ncbi:rhodanese-like domain-containing protein [Candidatus Vondammii sp. HM_W22]|uniref:rhodanese-like domain-containing protein n=1 Tax=Candidatus Vondammii sp. HM_W22 TaxID=2687299 RepID=UPI001F139C5A|nr:rhodanese-like domain-containing protein [Candidatus Vondammii sp. HM_W22]
MVKEIDSKKLESRITAGEDLMLLDIRSETEVAHGMLPNSEHLPMHLLPTKMNEFPADKEIILYCQSGARSHHACMYLMQQGLQNVVNLRGGIIDWARSGFEIVAYS